MALGCSVEAFGMFVGSIGGFVIGGIVGGVTTIQILFEKVR